MPVSKEEFRAALSRFASGVTVVTTKNNKGKLFGITVSAFCSVSLEPPLVLICIDKKTGSHHAFHEAGRFIVNFLREDQQNLSEHFASPLDDKFSIVQH
ncbi:MAG: flavin reductase family protein, partial [Pyrinomonadaceae bacterium]